MTSWTFSLTFAQSTHSFRCVPAWIYEDLTGPPQSLFLLLVVSFDFQAQVPTTCCARHHARYFPVRALSVFTFIFRALRSAFLIVFMLLFPISPYD